MICIDRLDQINQFTTSPICMALKRDRTLLALHQLIHSGTVIHEYVFEDFSLHDTSMSSVAFSESCRSLYCRQRYSTRLVGGAHPVRCVGWKTYLCHDPARHEKSEHMPRSARYYVRVF